MNTVRQSALLCLVLTLVACASETTESAAPACGQIQAGACDDGDPCTVDRELPGGFCATLEVPGCRCTPDCGAEAGDLKAGQVLRLGDGGFPGLAGPSDVVVTPDGVDSYLAASWEGRLTWTSTRDGALHWRGSVDIPGIRQIALDAMGQAVLATGTSGSFMVERQTDGTLGVPVASAGPGTGIVTWRTADGDGRIVLAHADGLRLYQLDTGWPELGSVVPDAGVREMVVSPDGALVFAAAWEDDRVSSYRVGVSGLEPLGTLSDPALARPDALALSDDGSALFVAGFCSHDIGVVDVSPAGTMTLNTTVWGADPIADCLASDFGEAEDGPDVLRVHRPTALAFVSDHLVVGGGSVGAPEVLSLRWDAETRRLQPTGFLEPAIDPLAMGTLPFVTDQENQPLPDDPAEVRGVVALAGADERLMVAALTTGAVATAPVSDEPRWDGLVQLGQHGVDGVGGVHEIDLSPDGRFLYTAPRSQNAVGIFAVGDDDTLTPLGATHLPVSGEIPGVIGTVRVVPDGRQVLAVDTFNPVLHVLDREPECGGLTLVQTVAVPVCREPDPLLVAVRTDPTGRDIYLSDFQRDGTSCLIHMQRDPATGVVGPGAVHYDDDFLDGVESFELTGDGRDLYTGSYFASAVGHYRRDPASGALTPGTPLSDPSLFGAEFLTLSEDERLVVVANPVESRLVVARRAPETGVLTLVQVIDDAPGGPWLDGAAGLVMTDTHLWVAAHHADAVNVFRVDGGAGQPLSFQSGLQGLAGLTWAHSVRLGPAGRRLLVGALEDSAVLALPIVQPGGDGCGGQCPPGRP